MIHFRPVPDHPRSNIRYDRKRYVETHDALKAEVKQPEQHDPPRWWIKD